MSLTKTRILSVGFEKLVRYLNKGNEIILKTKCLSKLNMTWGNLGFFFYLITCSLSRQKETFTFITDKGYVMTSLHDVCKDKFTNDWNEVCHSVLELNYELSLVYMPKSFILRKNCLQKRHFSCKDCSYKTMNYLLFLLNQLMALITFNKHFEH